MENKIKIGDLVIRQSHGGDLVFEIIKIDQESGIALLRCCDCRLMADAPVDDLNIYRDELEDRSGRLRKVKIREVIQNEYVRRKEVSRTQRIRRLKEYGQIYGTVLQIDGDKYYLEKCLSLYEGIKIAANGYHISEEKQPMHIQELLRKHRPDVLIITGHDGMKKTAGHDLSDYHTSRYFVESVLKARDWEPNKDGLVIFAGACQSFYEALIKAGANFASSPNRINIHTLDPVRVAEMIVLTPFKEIVSIKGVIHNSISGSDGIGGLESLGKMRLSLPKISKQNIEKA
ncbi:MAG: sporulation peptidase YabG [Halanaerobiales bacterium]|nr:sporulation peptidase YabG [Halanaerobiales bacterium]